MWSSGVKYYHTKGVVELAMKFVHHLYTVILLCKFLFATKDLGTMDTDPLTSFEVRVSS